MQGQAAGFDAVAATGFADQFARQEGAFAVGQHPADDAAAEDVDDDVELEIAPLGWSLELGNVPRPHLIGSGGEQFGLGIGGMGQLVTALTNLVVGGQDAIHGADRAEIDTLVEQGGVDLGGGVVHEAVFVQHRQNPNTLGGCHGARLSAARGWPLDRPMTETMEGGPRQPQGRAHGLAHPGRRLGNKGRQLSSSIAPRSIARSCAAFFWIPMINWALANCRSSRAFSRRRRSNSAVSLLLIVAGGPRRTGA